MQGLTERLRSSGLAVKKSLIAIAILAFLSSISAAEAKYASIIIDGDTGQVLQETNADDVNYPASLTKMMTLYLAFEALRDGHLTLDQQLPVSAHSASRAPSKLGLTPGETVAVRDLVLGIVTKSANDAATVMAESLGGGSESAFADQMTQKARKLGMKNTIFYNASGLPGRPENQTTARDLVTLARALYRDFPQDYHYFSTKEFSWRGATFTNHNHLMNSFQGMDGIKTGYINASGFNLAASAVRDHRRLIGAVGCGGIRRACATPRWRRCSMTALPTSSARSWSPRPRSRLRKSPRTMLPIPAPPVVPSPRCRPSAPPGSADHDAQDRRGSRRRLEHPARCLLEAWRRGESGACCDEAGNGQGQAAADHRAEQGRQGAPLSRAPGELHQARGRPGLHAPAPQAPEMLAGRAQPGQGGADLDSA